MELIDKVVITKSKTVKLKILNDGTCILYRPNKVNQKEVDNFIKLKESWIKKHKENKLLLYEKYKNLLNYSNISILNIIYNIEYINMNKNTQLVGESIITNNEKTLIKFLKSTAQELLIKRTRFLSNKFNIVPSKTLIENTKSRWGVCTSNREIKLNFRLVCLDTNLIDYVIIHELMHLIEFNHSKRFWSLIEKIIPNYKILKNKLKEYSFLFELYR